jgi:IS30 family transposase
MLVHLPTGRTAEAVRLALTRQIQRLPAELRRTLTWDQGKEIAEHAKFSVATDVKVYFWTLTALGSAAATRTRTAFFGSISPRTST